MKNILEHFEKYLGSALLAVMVSISFVNVLTRYFLRFSLAFTEELTIYLFVWVTMLGASLAFKEGANMAVNLLYDRFAKSVRRALYVLSTLLCVAFFLALMYWSWQEVCDEIAMNVSTEAMGLPVYIFTVSMPILSVLSILRIVQRAVSDLRTGNF